MEVLITIAAQLLREKWSHGGPARPGPLTPTPPPPPSPPPSQSGTEVPAVGAKGAGKQKCFYYGRG